MPDKVSLTLVRNGEVYTPEYAGATSLLLGGGSILHMDDIHPDDIGLPITVIDAAGCIITPGFIDPHQHLLGAGGEEGFGSRMPEVTAEENVRSGITTVVGCLGTDTVTRHLTSLLAKARQLDGEGITAYMYTGGFPVPPPTITSSITDDLVIVDAVIGVGEIAISDSRSSQPSLPELARIVSQAAVGGMMSGKAGVTHFHVGSACGRLSPLHALLDQYDVSPHSVYPTHITRSEALMDEAITLARRGAFVDIDTVNDDFVRWAGYYLDHGGPPSQLTVSSDAHTPGGAPHKVFGSFVAAMRSLDLPMQDILPFFTSNPASALKLEGKGQLRTGADADLLVLNRETLDIVHVFARGRHVLRDGTRCSSQESSREIEEPVRKEGRTS